MALNIFFMVSGVLCFLAMVICIGTAIWFYFFKFDLMLRSFAHPWAEGRKRDQLSLREQLNICTSLVVWLVFPNVKKGFVGKTNAMFAHVDRGQIDTGAKTSLLLFYGSALASLFFLGLARIMQSYLP